jgi:hypothetical protein
MLAHLLVQTHRLRPCTTCRCNTRATLHANGGHCWCARTRHSNVDEIGAAAFYYYGRKSRVPCHVCSHRTLSCVSCRRLSNMGEQQETDRLDDCRTHCLLCVCACVARPRSHTCHVTKKSASEVSLDSYAARGAGAQSSLHCSVRSRVRSRCYGGAAAGEDPHVVHVFAIPY